MPDLHLIITPPESGKWLDRMDVVEALEAGGWIGDEENPLGLLRRGGAIWGVINDSGDSGLDCPNGAVIEFPGDTPAVVIVAACLAAAASPAPVPAASGEAR